MGKVHNVITLREVALPVGSGWMTLADAEAAGVDLNDRKDAIGPRMRGMVYLNGYWGDVSTVHDVFVQTCPVRDGRGRFAGLAAVSWGIAEESASDHGRVRRHCTSWEHDPRNQPLFML